MKRETEKTQKEFPDSEEVLTFTTHFRLLLVKAIQLRKQPISDARYYEEAKKLKKQIVAAAEAPAQHVGIRYLQDIFCGKKDFLYQWVKDRDVPADNNFAERMIRFLAIARKVSFGSQSEQGAKTRSTLMTLLHTMELRGLDVSAVFKKALDAIAEDLSVDLGSLLFGKGTNPIPPQPAKKAKKNNRPANSFHPALKQNIAHHGPSPPAFQ